MIGSGDPIEIHAQGTATHHELKDGKNAISYFIGGEQLELGKNFQFSLSKLKMAQGKIKYVLANDIGADSHYIKISLVRNGRGIRQMRFQGAKTNGILALGLIHEWVRTDDSLVIEVTNAPMITPKIISILIVK